MRQSSSNSSDDDGEQEAAAWVLRIDRGLSAAEQDAYSDWLALDPRHRVQIARHRSNWSRLDQLGDWRLQHSGHPNPDLLAPRFSRHRRWLVPLTLACAAGVVLATFVFLLEDATRPGRPADATMPRSEGASVTSRQLTDGSVMEINRGAVVRVVYSEFERRVVLEHGEAHFSVTKDAARPFVVQVRGVAVRAIGTSFNVRVDNAAIEVLVTEGRVQLEKPEPVISGEADLVPSILEARQRAMVSLSSGGPSLQIATLTRGEIERVLAWQHRLLDFSGVALEDVVAEFNRRNVVQIVIRDPRLASVRVSAAVRSDNVDGLVRLLEAGFGARAERRGDTEIVLRAAR